MLKIKRNNNKNFQFNFQTDGFLNIRLLLVIGYWLLVVWFLIYTRFIGLDWGLPYPMHPDERNMANAIEQLKCEVANSKLSILNLKECFNPHFFAYGQFPLYLGYLIVIFLKFWDGDLGTAVGFQEAVISLRIVSAFSSILTAIIIIKIIKIITKKEADWCWWLAVIFSPFAIQYAHFGTTESLLMFFYSLIIYLCLKLVDKSKENQWRLFFKEIFFIGLVVGLAVATKISSLIFALVPGLVIAYLVGKKYCLKKSFFNWLKNLVFYELFFLMILTVFGVIFSPHNLINWQDFLGALRYESDVALGRYIVFYTKQFDGSLPLVFSIIKVIPYAVGGIGVIGFIRLIGFIGVKKENKILVLAFWSYFLANAFIFAKWTRFLAPVFPVLLMLGLLGLERIRVTKIIKVIIVILLISPGIFYLNIYLQPDIRFQASKWIFENIPENSYILSETANVVDIPLAYRGYKDYKSYNYISFNFYDLDKNLILQEELKQHLKRADYIFVPSRRIFANYTCYFPDQKENSLDKLVYEIERCDKLKKEYPVLNDYYKKLFSSQLGFRLIKTFESYPKIEFSILGKKISISFPDENAEETWSVFDHPVIRIYKKSF